MIRNNYVKLLIAAMMLGMASVPSNSWSGVIRIICEQTGPGSGNDNTELEYPHRAPIHFSNEASAHWNAETGLLSIWFYAESEEVTISIYKDDILVEEGCCSIIYGDVLNIDLSSYGNGDYQIIISGFGDENLNGTFSKQQ